MCNVVAENDNTAMDVLVSIMAELAVEFNISVDYCSHEAKASGGEPGDANRGRGATSMKDGGRLGYTLTTMAKEEAAAFGVAEDERKRLVRVDSAKVNICASQLTRWFRLVSVRLDNATAVYPNGDEVQTVDKWDPPEMFSGLETATLNAALERLAGGLPNGHRPKRSDIAAQNPTS